MAAVTSSLAALLLSAAGPPAGAPPFTVESARPLPSLTEQFSRREGWTGGDVAHSIPLGAGRTLWVFGDSWVGKVQGGRRVGARMVSNAAAWQSLTDPRAPLRFFWGGDGKTPRALLRPEKPDHWYWPGDGAAADGRLYLFCKLVRRQEKGPPGLQFDWCGNELLCVRNPQAEPTSWRVRRVPLVGGAGAPRLGVACLMHGDYLYAYGLFPARACKFLEAPVALARIHRLRLAARDGGGWEYWCRTPGGNRWLGRPADPAPLFKDGAPEMSVGRVRGLPGYVATYTSLGLGGDVVVRHAPRPEGPWSRPLRVYRCPDAGGGLLLYGAKAHPELARRDGELLVTYCRNVGSLAEHVRRPEVYVPQGVRVQLRLAPAR
jgi:hypothetical protein